jgi:hypothetical protein
MDAFSNGDCWDVLCGKEEVGGFFVVGNNGNNVDSFCDTDKDIWVYTGVTRLHSGVPKKCKKMENIKRIKTSVIFLSSAILAVAYSVLKISSRPGLDRKSKSK